ncbi:MAG: FHA domain-containing protein [Acidobacteriota bacterium]
MTHDPGSRDLGTDAGRAGGDLEAIDLAVFERLEDLEEERRQLVDWLDKLEAHRGQTPDEVLNEVRRDYVKRLEAVDAELKPLRSAARGVRQQVHAIVEERRAVFEEARKERDILNLRAQIGEFTDDPEGQARLEAARNSAAQAESALAEATARAEALKPTSGAADSGESEAVKSEAAKSEAAKSEAPKSEAPSPGAPESQAPAAAAPISDADPAVEPGAVEPAPSRGPDSPSSPAEAEDAGDSATGAASPHAGAADSPEPPADLPAIPEPSTAPSPAPGPEASTAEGPDSAEATSEAPEGAPPATPPLPNMPGLPTSDISPVPGGTVVNPALARTPDEVAEISAAEKSAPAWSQSSGWASKSFDSVSWPDPKDAEAPAPGAPESPASFAPPLAAMETPVGLPAPKVESPALHRPEDSLPTAAVPEPKVGDEPKLTGASRPFPLMPSTDGPRVAASSLERIDTPVGKETIDDFNQALKRETTTSRHRLLGATMAISRAHLIPELPTTHNRVVCLVSTDGDDVYYILEPHMTVGRQPTAGNQIVIEDAAISRQHARIHQNESGDFVITDLESSNGTFVNEERITSHTLELGDSVQFGPAGFVVSLLSDFAKPRG